MRAVPTDLQAELTAHAPAGMVATVISDSETNALVRVVWRSKNYDFWWDCNTPANNATELAVLRVLTVQAKLFPNG